MAELAIETFKETYNSNYLCKVPLYKILELKQTVNPILQKLITNFLSREPKTYMTEMIEGPLSFYKIKLDTPTVKKSFYIFGENHKIKPQGHCLPYNSLTLSEYIRRLSQESSSFFDFYIEFPMVRMSKPRQREGETKGEENKEYYDYKKGNPFFAINAGILSMVDNPRTDFISGFTRYKNEGDLDTDKLNSYIIQNLYDNFKECFNVSTRSVTERCNLMRIHPVDARMSWLSEEINDTLYMLVIYGIISDNLNFNYDNRTKIDLLNRINGNKTIELLSSLIDYNTNQFNFQSIDNILINKYVKKELDKVPEPMMSNILAFNREIIYSLATPAVLLNLKELILCLQNRMVIPVQKTYFQNLSNFLVATQACSMDIYCMARVFKRYNIKDSFQPAESKNVIIHTGANHSRRYMKFLTSRFVGGVMTHYSENTKGCVKITNRSLLANMKIRTTRDYFESLNERAIDNMRYRIIDEETLMGLQFIIQTANQNLEKINKNTALSDETIIVELERLKQETDTKYALKLEEKRTRDLDEEEERYYEEREFEAPIQVEEQKSSGSFLGRMGFKKWF
jgi:hypothetical protein